MTIGTLSALQTGFFSTRANATAEIGGFDPEVLDYAFSIRQTITTSEFFPAPIDLGPATQFEGPLQYMLAEYDFPVCGGDCRNTFDRDALRGQYPKAKGDIDIYTQPGNGHALTMHRGAGVGFKATLDWLDKNGF